MPVRVGLLSTARRELPTYPASRVGEELGLGAFERDDLSSFRGDSLMFERLFCIESSAAAVTDFGESTVHNRLVGELGASDRLT